MGQRPEEISRATGKVVKDVWNANYRRELTEIVEQHDFDGKAVIAEAHDAHGSSARINFLIGAGLIGLGSFIDCVSIANPGELTALGLVVGTTLIVGGLYFVKRSIPRAKRYRDTVDFAHRKLDGSAALEGRIEELHQEYKNNGYID